MQPGNLLGNSSRSWATYFAVGPCLGFDRYGEFAAWLTQERLYDGLARWALATELHAEHSVRWSTGTLSDHKAILVDRDLLNRVHRSNL